MTMLAAMIIFPVLMALAASSDLLTMTISNWISVALLFGFLVMAAVVGMPVHAIISHLTCGAAILALTFTLFCLGWIGGGDAKLAAATAVWIGWMHMPDYGFTASIGGGALTLLLLQARQWPLPAWAADSVWIARLHEKKGGIPYGIALAAAGLLVYPETRVWLSVIGS